MAHSVSCIRATNFIFDVHVPSDSPDAARYKFFEKGAWPRSCDPKFFGALVANSSRTAKATDCKVGTHVKIYLCKNSLVGDMHS